IPVEGKTILDSRGGLVFALVCVAALIIIIGVVFVEQGQRRIPVQYAKRMVGRRMYGGTSTYLPLKVNQAGVIPVIFASSLIYIPHLITQLITSGDPNAANSGFSRFIPDIRPGAPTADYLRYVLNRITLPGSIYLGVIAVLPNLFLQIGNTGSVQNIPFGGTAVLIMVGVGLDTVKQIESQLMQRNYEGFLK